MDTIPAYKWISMDIIPAYKWISKDIIPAYRWISKDTILMNIKWISKDTILKKLISKDALPASLHRLPGELRLHRDCPDVHLEQD